MEMIVKVGKVKRGVVEEGKDSMGREGRDGEVEEVKLG